jgi:hypothetical protein
MAGPSTTITTTDILIGPGQLWWGLFPLEPADADIGTPPGAGFADAGATSGGLTQTVAQTFFEAEVDQAVDAVARRLINRRITLATSMAEATLEKLAIALNHDPATAVETIVGPPAAKKLELLVGQDAMRLTDLVIVVDGFAPSDGAAKMRRTIIRKCNSIESVGKAYQKDATTLIPVTFGALYVDATTSPVAWLDET